MQISDIHALALEMLNSDSGDYETSKLMSYTNDGISYINNIRIQARDPEVIKTLTLTAQSTPKPSDFFGFMPPTSAYPVIAIGTTLEKAIGAPPTVAIKYSTKPLRVTGVSDDFPLPDDYAGYVAQYIKIKLKDDNNDTDVTQDLKLLNLDTDAFIKAKGG